MDVFASKNTDFSHDTIFLLCCKFFQMKNMSNVEKLWKRLKK